MSLQPPITHLLYLHGFRSSPQSKKASLMARHMAARHPSVTWCCPQLPPSPRQAMAEVLRGIADWPRASMAVVGSSLGGFYATWVAQTTGCRAVLLNPAVDPARDLQTYIGEQSNWHDPTQRFFFRSEFVQELRDLALPELTQAQRYMVVIAKGDELLDWREMHARYAGAHIRLLEGGDHALSDFERHLPAVMAFLGLD
ncbi:MAG: esterase [Rhodoferax sp.]|uniref:YqiA/YcfP family alpha/beta fold hydrolase n=1 Tax=Rhodoferax sp. TaxID=50421 RepID=UPI002605CB48|nr:YqiA/YcfP family alpha/beta fold hydrolase [Rhodoferax sp.]MDD5333720.1 esterase [Rhodoferax sp.]